MPFEPFSQGRLEEVLRTHPLGPEGYRFVADALLSPSRNVQGTTKNVVSDFPCPKMRGNAQAESWSAESPFTLEHIFNPDVVGYTNQVPPIELLYRGRNNKSVRTRYTGDCLCIHRKYGVVVEEWKSAGDRGQLEHRYPGKYVQLDSGEYTSIPISDVVNKLGIRFVVRFSDEIDSVATRNRRYLFQYLSPAAHKTYAKSIPDLFDLLRESSCRTYADMLDAGAGSDALNWAVANGYLHIDFSEAPLAAQQGMVHVFRHEETLQAWIQARRPNGLSDVQSNRMAPQELSCGDAFIFDGRRLIVELNGATAVYAKDEHGQSVCINLDTLVMAVRAGKVSLPDCAKTNTPRSRLWSASPDDLRRALRRVEILQRIERKEMLRADEQYSPSTYRRWRKAIVEGKSKGMSAVEALIDFASDRGFRGDHIETGLSGLINGLIKNGLENRLHQSVLAMYFDIEKQVRSAGYQMIAKSSFYERVSNIRSIETISRSEGHKAAYQLEPVYWMLDMETPIHCERAMELVHVDSTLLDVELRSSISGEVLGRPWLTIAICAYSRRVVGMHLSFRPPSYVSTMMVLADVIRRTGRLPDAVIHDWGSEFKAKDWKYLLTTLFIVRHVRPKSAPRFGAVLERLFGIVTRELIDNIAGNTKLRRNVRQLSPSHDPSTHSGLYLSDIYCGLEEYFFSIYDGTKHPATLQSPKERYDNSFVTHGARLDRVRRFDDLLPILMPTIKGRSRAVDRARGVVVNYRHYGNPILANMNVHAAAPVLKAVPFDPGIILAFVNGDWVICKSDVYTELRHAPDVVRRSLFEEWLIEQRIAVSAHDERRRSVRGLIERLNERAMQNKEYWRDREYQKFVAVSDVGPCDNSDDNGSIAELDKMMQKALVVARGIGSAGHLVMVSK